MDALVIFGCLAAVVILFFIPIADWVLNLGREK